jgi:Domain of unknown function (DUF5011)
MYMKNIKYILFYFGLIVLFTNCERDFESEGITVGVLRYPSVKLKGAPAVVVVQGETYQEQGATALLGEEDISTQVLIEGDVDTSTPGVYPVNYSVAIQNEIGKSSVSSQTRYVIVATEDISDVDLSGDYIGTGFSSNPSKMKVTKIADGWYNIPDVLSSANGIGANFAHLGGDVLLIPYQDSSFGPISSVDAFLTAEGFTWTIALDCCGEFGPIEFVKQ